MVANAYPSDRTLYANAFIHTRVRAYRQAGLDVSVVVVKAQAGAPYEFEGVPVEVVDARGYARIVAEGGHEKYLVHFPHPYMLEPIAKLAPHVPVIAWVHGYETEKWHRRWFNLVDDPAAIRTALKRRETHSGPQLEFMRWLFTTTDLDITVVQVSEWFRDHISEADVGARARRCVVIPNPIDAELFAYRRKDPSLRTKVLAIRPYASRKYANDLTVAAIRLLASHPYFGDFNFTLYGDGPLWERTTAPLAGLRNVTLHRTFLEQSAIPDIHAAHGVYLSPTRFDSQGVSMCEAMSSGLVPIATAVSAIPEFVEDGRTGLLGTPESAHALAQHLDRLYREPETFVSLSREAAAGIRDKCGAHATTKREVELIQS